MAHFVLVHGASHGVWCWRKVVPLLEAAGHEVAAIDLPAHEDVTLAEYCETVLAAAHPGSIVVGHSLAGLSITLAGADPNADIRALVYVAAFVPEPGARFADFRKDAISPKVDTVTRRDGGYSVPIREGSADIFYNHCNEADQAYALARLAPQPISVMTEALEFTPHDLPRHYVLCTDDRVVLPDYQRRITQDWPEGTVHELATGHSPFFSETEALARILNSVAEASA